MSPLSTLRLRVWTALFMCVFAIAACKKSSSGNSNSTSNNNNNNNNNNSGGGGDAITNGQAAAPTPIGTPVGNASTKMIGAAGGVLYSPDSVVQLTIPAGALTVNTNISIQPITNTMPGGLGLGYDLLPNGTKFTTPATITFRYTTDQVADNFPYFLNIAYQDGTGIWQGDLRERYFDTVARTVSLDVSHFTSFGVQDGINVQANPRTIYAGQTSNVTMDESVVLNSDGSTSVTATSPIPQNYVGPWMVNGIPGGNSSVGTITGTGGQVVYNAPEDLGQTITVFVSAVVKVTETFTVKGKKVTIKDPVRGQNITVLPFAEYNYLIKVDFLDSSISTMYSSIPDPTKIPVYYDHASFEIKIRAKKVPELTFSDIQNYAPTCTPSTAQTEHEIFTWLVDAYGEMDVASLSLGTAPFMPEDSVLDIFITHGHATQYGVLNTFDGVVLTNTPPTPFPAGTGFPSVFFVDLKKHQLPYLSISEYGIYKSLNVAVLPGN